MYPAGYYVANDPMLRTQYITNVVDLPLTLARYSSNTGAYPVARTLMKAMTFPPYTPGLEAMDVLERMTTTLLNHPDNNVRMHAVEQMARYVPDLYLEILTNYGITLNGPSDSAYAMSILYSQATGGSGASLYRAKLYNLFYTNPDLLMPWLEQATADSLYLNAPGGWSTATGYETMLRDALNTFGNDAAQDEAMSMGTMPKDAVGMYGAISWWPHSMEQVSYWSGGGLPNIAYYSDPVNYITSLTAIRGAAFLDTALAWVPDYELNLPALAGDVLVPLSTVQLANLAGHPYLRDQSIYLSNHHMYGSSRLGISQYLSSQYKYRYNYEFGMVDTFGMTTPRPWYSYELNSHVKAGEVYPHGNPMDSVALAEHVLGQKQYEMVNHLSNVQEVITDKKYWKDTNGDGDRDEAKAVVQSVYDYYPFGQLMAGRSILDTTGMCVTRTRLQEIPVYKWVPGAGMSIGGNVTSEGGTNVTASTSGGVDVSGTSGGIRYQINNITAHAIQLRTYFAMLNGTATITIWDGTTVGVGGTQLGSTTSSFTSPAPVINTSVGGTTTAPKTITVVVSMGMGSDRSLFSVDSIGYQTFSWTVATGIYTTCGEPKDHYEFGYNGQMKSNEIAGMGNHNTALFWEYDTRLGRRWNLDPEDQVSASNYSVFAGNPIIMNDIEGDSPGDGDKDSKGHQAGGAQPGPLEGAYAAPIPSLKYTNTNWDYLRAVVNFVPGVWNGVVTNTYNSAISVTNSLLNGTASSDAQADFKAVGVSIKKEVNYFVSTPLPIQVKAMFSPSGVESMLTMGAQIWLGKMAVSGLSGGQSFTPSQGHTGIVYHSTSSVGSAERVLAGINPKRFSPGSRFGRGLYMADDIGTTIAELKYHKNVRVNTIRYTMVNARLLDATGSIMKLGVRFTPKPLGLAARAFGYDGIRYGSLRNAGGMNTVLFKNWQLLQNGTIVY